AIPKRRTELKLLKPSTTSERGKKVPLMMLKTPKERVFLRRGKSPPHPLQRRSTLSSRAQRCPRAELRNRGRPQHHPKAEVVVPGVGPIPEAGGAAGEASIVAPRAAAHDPQYL